MKRGLGISTEAGLGLLVFQQQRLHGIVFPHIEGARLIACIQNYPFGELTRSCVSAATPPARVHTRTWLSLKRHSRTEVPNSALPPRPQWPQTWWKCRLLRRWSLRSTHQAAMFAVDPMLTRVFIQRFFIAMDHSAPALACHGLVSGRGGLAFD